MGGSTGWYDLFASFYDSSTEKLYVEQRVLARQALDLQPGQSVLDLPCGTGQSLGNLATGEGTYVGVDFSAGMLARCARKAGDKPGIVLLQGDARTVSGADLEAAGGPPEVDRLHVFLGMTAFPDWQAAFTNLWGLLAPGGRCVLVDVHADPLTFQGRMVNLVARADITRRFWEPLEAVAEQYERRELPSLPEHGGTMYLATGIKPA
jgi:ubiquinone/menaquinone biosynthesis C-methylase UbiE